MSFKLSSYELSLIVVTAVVFFGGISSAYFIYDYLSQVKTAVEINYELISQIEHNLEGNVTAVNQTVAELEEELHDDLKKQFFLKFFNLTAI